MSGTLIKGFLCLRTFFKGFFHVKHSRELTGRCDMHKLRTRDVAIVMIRSVYLVGCQARGWALPSRMSNDSLRGRGKVIRRYYLKQLRQSSWRIRRNGALRVDDCEASEGQTVGHTEADYTCQVFCSLLTTR